MKSFYLYISKIDFPADLHLFFYTLVKIIHFRGLIKRQSFSEITDAVIKRTNRFKDGGSVCEKRKREIIRISKISGIILSRFSNSNPCLVRSLLLFKAIRKRGIKAKLVIGVRKSGANPEGHSYRLE